MSEIKASAVVTGLDRVGRVGAGCVRQGRQRGRHGDGDVVGHGRRRDPRRRDSEAEAAIAVRGVGGEGDLHLRRGADAAGAGELMASPEALLEPAPPAPAVPDWLQEPALSLTFVGAEPRACEGMTVRRSWAVPASDVPGLKSDREARGCSSATAAGEATTLPTAVPIV